MPLVTIPRKSAARKRVDAMFNDKWRLERLLGVGGMGAVYEARHRNGSRVAIKVLHADLASSPRERERFLREAYIANRVEHPAVVRVLDDGMSDDEPYLVMELVEGDPLDALAATLAEPELLDVAEQVLDALVVAHARGIVHRDIKPQNLLLDRARRVRILDFGLAHIADDPTGAPVSDAGTIVGTVEYMAPEQVVGEQATARSDLYSLGATLFRLASRQHLHGGANVLDQIRRIATEPARSLASVGQRFDGEVVALVDRATQLSTEHRWPNAEQMRREVRRIRTKMPPSTWDLGRGLRSEEPTRRAPRPAPATAPGWSRPTTLAIGAAVTLIVLLLVVARAMGAQ